ncbi:MAG: ribbon-helix-helix domain-containing protein [Staphylococcus equorum]
MVKVKKSFTLDDEIYEKLKRIAEKEDRSLSQQLNKIIRDYLEK